MSNGTTFFQPNIQTGSTLPPSVSVANAINQQNRENSEFLSLTTGNLSIGGSRSNSKKTSKKSKSSKSSRKSIKKSLKKKHSSKKSNKKVSKRKRIKPTKKYIQKGGYTGRWLLLDSIGIGWIGDSEDFNYTIEDEDNLILYSYIDNCPGIDSMENYITLSFNGEYLGWSVYVNNNLKDSNDFEWNWLDDVNYVHDVDIVERCNEIWKDNFGDIEC